MTNDPNLIYPGSDLTNVFPEEGMDMTPTQAQIEAAENLAYFKKSYADDLARGRNPCDFGMRWMQNQISEWEATLAAAAEVKPLRGDDAYAQGYWHGKEEGIDATIERCAQVADSFGYGGYEQIAEAIAAAIRALKEKSHDRQ